MLSRKPFARPENPRYMRRSRFKVSKKSKDLKSALSKWSQAVKERDGGICQRCFREGHHSHHIAARSQRPDLRLELSNGVYLCFGCHKWVHDNPIQATASGFLSVEKYEQRELTAV